MTKEVEASLESVRMEMVKMENSESAGKGGVGKEGRVKVDVMVLAK